MIVVRPLYLLLIGVSLLGIAGCGGSGGHPTASASTAGRAPAVAATGSHQQLTSAEQAQVYADLVGIPGGCAAADNHPYARVKASIERAVDQLVALVARKPDAQITDPQTERTASLRELARALARSLRTCDPGAARKLQAV